MIVRSKAPLRISFSGGGTDVSPYPEERGGVVLSATINKYAYATLRPRYDDEITVTSLDYDVVAKYGVDSELRYNGELDLVKAAIRSAGDRRHGFDLFIHTDAPPGSGLGSSSTMVVALLGLMNHWLRRSMTLYEVADLCYRIERQELGIKGGKQDQYAAAFGGFNFIEFYKDVTIVNPLRIRPEVINELQYRLVLCYTGKTRVSGDIISSQVQRYVSREKESVESLDALKQITFDLKAALLKARLDDFGALLHEAWERKKRLASGITNPIIDELYAAARSKGALGGKILGAGGGGYLLVYCPFDRRHKVAEALEACGGQVVDFDFEFSGLTTWEIPEPDGEHESPSESSRPGYASAAPRSKLPSPDSEPAPSSPNSASREARGEPQAQTEASVSAKAPKEAGSYVQGMSARHQSDLIAAEEAARQLVDSGQVKLSMAKEEGLISSVVRMAEEIADTISHGGKVLTAGNGGSCADAQHFAAELVGKFRLERPAAPAIALTANTSVLTAIGNDYDFSRVFTRQVEAFGAPGDILVVISTSGNSENLIEAVQKARGRGLKVFGLLGGTGGRLLSGVDSAVVVPSIDTPRIQEAHIAVIHVICDMVERRLFGDLARR